jgi:hypothetical protein
MTDEVDRRFAAALLRMARRDPDEENAEEKPTKPPRPFTGGGRAPDGRGSGPRDVSTAHVHKLLGQRAPRRR